MRVSFEQLKQEFERVLLARGVQAETASECATMFAQTTESGVYSHGVNRFPRFIQQGTLFPKRRRNEFWRWARLSSGTHNAQLAI